MRLIVFDLGTVAQHTGDPERWSYRWGFRLALDLSGLVPALTFPC